MTELPTVSVILTAFKRTKYIKTAIESVLRQTYTDYEIIVSDDSASDEIAAIVQSFKAPNIFYNPSPVRKGVAAVVSDSIVIARGSYIAILNDDDAWEPDFLLKLVTPLLEAPRVFAFCDHWLMDDEGVVDEAKTNARSRQNSRAELSQGDLPHPGTTVVVRKSVPMAVGAVFRKDALDPKMVRGKAGGAYDFWLSCILAASGKPVYYTPLRLTRYRVHGQMETERKDPNKHEDELFILDQVIKRGWFKDINQQISSRYASVSSSVALNKLRFSQKSEARRFALDGLKSSVHWRCIAVLLMTFAPRQMLTGIIGRPPRLLEQR